MSKKKCNFALEFHAGGDYVFFRGGVQTYKRRLLTLVLAL